MSIKMQIFNCTRLSRASFREVQRIFKIGAFVYFNMIKIISLRQESDAYLAIRFLDRFPI